MTLACPQCASRTIGRVAADHFYCWECCIEFSQVDETVQCFQVNEEGELLQFDPNHAPPAAQ